MNRVLDYRWSDIAKLAGLVLAYSLLGQIMLAYFSLNGTVCILWPSAGVGLATLMTGGKKYAPGIFAGAMASSIMTGTPAAVSVFVAFGNTLGALAGIRLLTKAKLVNAELKYPQDYLYLGIAAIVDAGVSAAVGVAALLAGGIVAQQAGLQNLLQWWQGDLLGIILVTPLILVWRHTALVSIERNRIIEAIACFSLAFLAGQVIFLGWFHDTAGAIAKGFIMFIFVAWSAVRFGRHGALLVIGIVAVQALLGAVRNVGYFAADIAGTGLVNYWIFMLVLTVTGVMLALIVNTLKLSEQRLALLSFGMNRMHDTACLINENARLLYVNDEACKAFKYTRSELLKLSVSDIDTIYSTDRWQEHWQALKANGSMTIESIHKTRDGYMFPVEVSANYFEYDGIGYNLALARDISERKRAEQREQSRNRVLELLTQGVALKDILEVIVRTVEQEAPYMRCSILLMDDEGKHLLHGAAPNLPDFFNTAVHGGRIGMSAGSCGTAAFTGERVIVEDIQTHPYWADYKGLAARAALSACWSEPVKNVSGQVLGTFAVYYHDIKAPSETDIQLITRMSHLAAIAIERSRINEELQLATLVYQNSSEAMVVTDADGCIITVNPAFTALTGYTRQEVIGRHITLFSSGYQDKAAYQAMSQELSTLGHWQGELWNRRKSGEIYAEWLAVNTIYNEAGLPHRRVTLISDISKMKESKELIWRQANFDPLTGLPNRRMFHERLHQEIKTAKRAGLPLALLFIDLDHFKEVNDTLGHGMGDLLLKEAALRLSRCVRETDSVSRLGGDEFTIILSRLDSADCVERITQDILQKLLEPFQLGIESAYVSASIGITLYPVDAGELETLIKNADQAMYAAKEQGRNRYQYFTPSMQETAQNRMRLANDLRGALADHQLQMVYQPIVELATGNIRKAEALLRWQHPQRGLISPAEFIPVAEDTGMITPIGDWVFHEAACQVKQWRASHHKNFQVSINKSPVQFRNKGNDHSLWFDCLKALELPGQSMVVEITEGLLMDAGDAVTDQLSKFRAAGIQVSLDDFGTGYSSLSYLKKFAIDYLKIDQSFVCNLESHSSDMALCEAIIVMAHKLGIKVIAEGIETEQQRALLAEAGCDYGQGYLFSKPVSADEFTQLLLNNAAAMNHQGSHREPA